MIVMYHKYGILLCMQRYNRVRKITTTRYNTSSDNSPPNCFIISISFCFRRRIIGYCRYDGKIWIYDINLKTAGIMVTQCHPSKKVFARYVIVCRWKEANFNWSAHLRNITQSLSNKHTAHCMQIDNKYKYKYIIISNKHKINIKYIRQRKIII